MLYYEINHPYLGCMVYNARVWSLLRARGQSPRALSSNHKGTLSIQSRYSTGQRKVKRVLHTYVRTCTRARAQTRTRDAHARLRLTFTYIRIAFHTRKLSPHSA